MTDLHSRKSCVVPKCTNTTTKTPEKLFFHVPMDVQMRKKWIKAMNRLDSFGPKSAVYCCEDHFDCFNSTVRTPEKLFFYVPEDPNMRKNWINAVKRLDTIGPNTTAHCCEDHFNLEDDMENYIKYKLVGGILKLKKGTLPHKFKCQEEINDIPERSTRRKRKILVTEKEIPTDEIETYSGENDRCCGCLKGGDEMALKEYNIQFEPLKDILKVDSITLCYLCKQIARRAEYFIRNVQNTQILLQNYEGDTPELKQCFPPTILTLKTLPPVELPEDGEEESCMVISGEVKMERVEEQVEDAHGDYEEIFIKEEDISHYVQPKEEVASEEDSCIQNLPEIERNRKRNIDIIIPRKRKIMLVKKKSMATSRGAYETEYRIERVTEKQCMREREQRSQDSRYLSCIYRCADCVKGFMHKTSFDMHMNLHSLSRGDFPCAICKQRFESSKKMAAHRKCHIYRYRCTKCEVSRISHSAIRSHYAAKHSTFVHHCTMCPKVFKTRVTLRKHLSIHSGHERVTCDDCQQTFKSKDTLRNHILRKHPPDGVSENYRKRHVCQHCGMAFKAPYLLKSHVAMHTENRPYYCVECDRSFKTDKILTRHLKTASRHVFNADLHVTCDQCEKRFTCRRDLQRHVNSAHLNLRPHACDKCDRAYLNSWSLREHKMYSHEGYRKERRYPCTLCDKVFDRSSILKSHIRTHTGERPYRCKHCPSQFVQSSQLRTHTNLVHLKLTRDGKPKSTALK